MGGVYECYKAVDAAYSLERQGVIDSTLISRASIRLTEPVPSKRDTLHLRHSVAWTAGDIRNIA
ncbi:predicted protein [Botrytis cinerea T4]|uniref:Uncharacterized protein n=1 Tax=Botryotinia fuckeliana (strain T4) TaxID=999810 RepID=G2YT84_BOTF4|nr:predicted protein [Botrytis cinerea T4]